jgi:hypothetical protein
MGTGDNHGIGAKSLGRPMYKLIGRVNAGRRGDLPVKHILGRHHKRLRPAAGNEIKMVDVLLISNRLHRNADLVNVFLLHNSPPLFLLSILFQIERFL